ncbi:hypothetical protein HYX01_03595 [Candidatus Woesearchaeota archaeon]|nr:hypothetical protein [Candidatus Woesearchaeota archaeon]
MATSFKFQDFFVSLDRLGFVDVLLPFLLIFTVLFAVLEKTKIMGDTKKNMNLAIALILSLLTVIPHATGNYPAGYDPVEIINKALPSVSLVVVAVIALMILIGVFAHDKIFLGLTAPGLVAIFSISTLVYIFGSAAGWWANGFVNWLESVFGSDVLAVVIMVLVFGIIVAYVTSDPAKEFELFKGLQTNINNLFGGGKK